jgi:hypothetical protein
MSEPLKHRAICYDDEGSLECCCELRKGLDYRQAELLSRAEADRLVNDYALEMTALVLNSMRTDEERESE